MSKKTLIIMAIITIFLNITNLFSEKEDENVKRIIKNTIKFLGGEKFKNYKTYYAHGKLYIIKGGMSARTDVWEYINYPSLFRQALEDKENGDIEIVDISKLKGIRIKYGKKSSMSLSDISEFKMGLRRDIHYLFKYIIPEGKVSIYYLSPEEIEGPLFNEGLKLIFDDNDEIKIIYKEESYIPYKIIYKKKEGLTTVRWYKILARWFSIDGIETPKRIEYYREGNFTYLLEYEEIKYNKNLSKKLFQIR